MESEPSGCVVYPFHPCIYTFIFIGLRSFSLIVIILLLKFKTITSSQPQIMSSQKIMEQVWENIPEDKSIAVLATGSIIGGSLPFLAGYLVPVSILCHILE